MSDGLGVGGVIAILVGIIVVVFVIRWLAGRGADAVVNNTVGKKSRVAGDAMTSSDLVLTTAADVPAVIGAVRQHVPAGLAAPAVATSLYVVGATDSGVRYAYGNKLGTSFQAQVVAVHGAHGTEVLVEVTNWTKSGNTKAGSTVQDGQRMQRLRDEVVAAVRSIDPASTARVVAR